MTRKKIWIPDIPREQKQVVELPTIGIEGRYYVDLIDSASGKIKQHLEFKNLITDAGLNLIGTGTSITASLTTLVVGVGSTTPAVTDADLVSPIASTSFAGGFVDTFTTQTTPLEFAACKKTRLFLGTEANAALTELGWKTGSVLVNRSLFKDAAGNPTTVNKTNTDLLRIVYEYRLFAPLNDVTGTAIFGEGSNSVVYTIRPQNVNQSPGWVDMLAHMGSYATPFARAHEEQIISSRTSNNDPSPSDDHTTSSFGTYTPGSFFRDMEYEWRPGDGNHAAGIGLVTWNPWYASGQLGMWQMHLSESINKTENNRLSITFRQRWARV